MADAQGTDDCLMLSLSLAYREKDDYTPPPLTLFGSFLSPGKSAHREIDVNRSYTSTTTMAEKEEEEEEDDALLSSPNSTLSSISGKRSIGRDRHDLERASSSDEEGGGGGGDTSASRKKLRLCKEQAMVLEEAFKEHNTLNPKQKTALAKQLNLRPRQVEVWFQNRRARTKLKQNEVDCEYLRRYCENLMQENKRLEKELNELRSLKLSSPPYNNNNYYMMTMSPPTTLTMCPQCVRLNNSTTNT